MEFWDRYLFARHIAAALAQGVFVALVLPLLAMLLFQEPVMPTLALIGSGLVIEYGAAPVGIALGLPPLFVFWVLICTETGIFIGLYDIFDAVGHTWPPAADFLARTQQFLQKNPVAGRYGILGLVPCEILIGVYANAPVSWVLGWRRERSLAFTMIGYVPCLVLSILATIGLLGMYFPGLVYP
jgi:hypothetical protein